MWEIIPRLGSFSYAKGMIHPQSDRGMPFGWVGNKGEGMRGQRLHVSFQGYGHTHHFCICSRSELCERKEVELWRLHQPLVNSVFSTGGRIKGEYGGALCDSYFERI